MQFTVKVKELSAGLSRFQSIVGAAHVSMKCNGKRKLLSLSATKDGRTLFLGIPADVTDQEGKATVDINILSTLIAKRDELEFKLDDNILKFQSIGKGKKYNGDIAVLPYEEVEAPEVDAEEESVPEDVLKFVSTALPQVRCTNVYTEDPMFLVVAANKKRGTRLSVYDNFHIAYARNPNLQVDQDLSFCLPLAIMDTIVQVANGNGFSLIVTDTRVLAKGEGFLISLPMMTNPYGEQSVDEIEGHIKSMKEIAADAAFTARLDDVSEAITNCMAIADSEKCIEFSNKDDQVRVHLKTNFGTVNSIFTVEGVEWNSKTPFQVEPNLVYDVMALVKPSVITVSFAAEKFMCIEANSEAYSAIYFCNIV